ncbi:glutamate 5-kinase [Alteromonas pelagimontana]|uniref:Glutamate 5-kinase n=1 Tax=Alteromonas pelagimontana TaxID=1858656 RepID=A0A6M4MDJ9_9ALTE|nr:glutamate 5-kinase [Alteromonas pelagimontana]QJR80898.1 glutamate 5-kinase [Alteromonas pelagimontana]
MNNFSWQRAVIKVGSALIAPEGNQCSARYLLPIARFITASREAGKEIIVVSSGSVAAGRSKIPIHHPASIAEKQAMAAIGQTQMMANWQRFFDFPCAQVLLTADDLHDRTRYVNIKNTLRELLLHQALPIVNENDTVAVNELKVGDNDNLGAYTALVAHADTLIICSDIDGLYTADPRKHSDATLIPKVSEITPAIYGLAGGAGTAMGTGGMRTKIEAADKCTKSGIQTLIVNGRNGQVFDALAEGRSVGTLFTATQSSKRARRLWLAHTLKTRGIINVDAGAKQAIVDRGASLLPSGIVTVSGGFSAGDAVEVRCNNIPVAKGLALYDEKDLVQIKGLKSHQIGETLGYDSGEVVIHRDDLVLL